MLITAAFLRAATPRPSPFATERRFCAKLRHSGANVRAAGSRLRYNLRLLLLSTTTNMTQRATGQRFRQRKLSTKQNLPVLRENEVEKLPDDDAQRHIPKVETGVEKGEEIVSFRA